MIFSFLLRRVFFQTILYGAAQINKITIVSQSIHALLFSCYCYITWITFFLLKCILYCYQWLFCSKIHQVFLLFPSCHVTCGANRCQKVFARQTLFIGGAKVVSYQSWDKGVQKLFNFIGGAGPLWPSKKRKTSKLREKLFVTLFYFANGAN